MKKLFLFLLLSTFASSIAHAQARAGGSLSSTDYTGGGVTESRNTGVGIKGGYNRNGLRGEAIKGIDRNSHSDFHAGVYGQFGFNNFSSVQVELLYSRQGFAANTGVSGARENYRMDYVALPVMFVGNITETISFHVGPQVSLLVKAQNDAGQSLDFASNGFNTFDFGGVGGLEARIGPARVGARYNLSLGKIFADGTYTSTAAATRFSNADLYNNLLQLYVGIGFTQ